MSLFTRPHFQNQITLFLKGLVHFQNKNFLIIYLPHVIQDVHVFLSSVTKKLSFLRKAFQDFSPYSGLQWRPMG